MGIITTYIYSLALFLWNSGEYERVIETAISETKLCQR